MLATTDKDIRAALHGKKLKSHRGAPDTLVVDELGLAHAAVRVDIAVINGCIHGFEIKSSVDTLERLPNQLDHYRRCLGKLTLVCAPKHTKRAMKLLPDWCGLIEAEKGPRGGVSFETVRLCRSNPEIDPVQLAHLLWRGEVASLLASVGASAKELRAPRKQLYASLAKVMTVGQITAAIRNSMMQRAAWRDHPTRA